MPGPRRAAAERPGPGGQPVRDLVAILGIAFPEMAAHFKLKACQVTCQGRPLGP